MVNFTKTTIGTLRTQKQYEYIGGKTQTTEEKPKIQTEIQIRNVITEHISPVTSFLILFKTAAVSVHLMPHKDHSSGPLLSTTTYFIKLFYRLGIKPPEMTVLIICYHLH